MKKIPPTNPARWQEFGAMLFRSRDADPGYYVLHDLGKAGVDHDQRKRFAVAWCAYYNLGIAARASELRGAQFWRYLNSIYATATRSSERRHFRGKAGIEALAQWQFKFVLPERMAEHLVFPHGNWAQVRAACADVKQMGPYFIWKWGDLTEVLSRMPLNFRGAEQHSPKVPQEGAALIAAEAGKSYLDTRGVYEGIRRRFYTDARMRPWYIDREFDVQDSETVCCVYKQYRSGGYWPGSRTAKALGKLASVPSDTGALAARLLIEHQPAYDADYLAATLADDGPRRTVDEVLEALQ